MAPQIEAPTWLEGLIRLKKDSLEIPKSKGLSRNPKKSLAVLTCMDSRIDLEYLVDIGLGEAHIIRNAGAILTQDVIRSLSLSQLTMGTTHIIVMGHTTCGLETKEPNRLKELVIGQIGIEMELGTFSNVFDSVRETVKNIVESPYIPIKDHVAGLVADLEQGSVTYVSSSSDFEIL